MNGKLKWSLKAALVVLAMYAMTSNAAVIRFDNIGQGEAPGIMLQGMSVGGLETAFGFQHEYRATEFSSVKDEGAYYPWMDVTFSKMDETGKGFFGRVGTNFEWNPEISIGAIVYLSDWAGVTGEYSWFFDKSSGLVYKETRSAEALSVGFFAAFDAF